MQSGSASSQRFIYGLHDGSGVIRYVGMSKDPTVRVEQHVREAQRRHKRNAHKEAWIRKVIESGGHVECEILEVCDEQTWQERETQWIARLNQNLTNIAPGGGKPPVNRKQCSINAKNMMASIDYPIIRLKRFLKRTATELANAGDMSRAERLVQAWIAVDLSTGRQRELFREMAIRRLGNGKKTSTT